MKTEDLKALGLNDDQVQKVFAMNGTDMNDLKQQVTTLTTERDAARSQLAKPTRSWKAMTLNGEPKQKKPRMTPRSRWQHFRTILPPKPPSLR